MTTPQDEFAEDLLRRTISHEALAWLQGGTRRKPRTLGEDESTADSIQLVEEIYAAGAVQVFAVEIDQDEEGENTGKLVIELPAEPKYREMVLEIAGKIAESQGFDRQPDIGQKYAFVMLD